jgi:hypothetical protein
MPTPLTSVAAAAVLYDRVAELLEKLLRSNTVTSAPVQPLASPPGISGPDAELLRLQTEALALAVEALNLRPKAPPAAAPKPPER